MSFKPFKELECYVPIETVEKMFDHCNRVMDRVLLEVMFWTGARASEVVNIRYSDVDFDQGVIKIITLKQKDRPYRYVPVSSYLLRLIDAYCKEKKISGDDYLFPITYQAVYKIVRKVAERAGVTTVGNKYFHPHVLRHSFAVHALKSGVNIRSLQQVLGHSNINTTTTYLQLLPSDLRQEFKKVFGDDERIQ